MNNILFSYSDYKAAYSVPEGDFEGGVQLQFEESAQEHVGAETGI